MSILFLTPMLPSMRLSGGEVVSQAVVEALRSAGHKVVVVGYRWHGTTPPLHPDDLTAGERHIETRASGARPVVWMARALATGQPYSFAKFASKRYLRVARAAAARQPAGIVVDHAASAWTLPWLGLTAPYAYLAHNVEHRLIASRARLVRPVIMREVRLRRRVEQTLATEASRVWALTENDAQVMRTLGAGDRVTTLSPPATPDPAVVVAHSAEADVRLLGTWTWGPNAAGLRWFLAEVVPQLPEGITVEIGGQGADAICGNHSGVSCVGRVADAMLFLQGARALAVPSTGGEGIQVKTLDAIASGVPVVATGIGLRGIRMPPPSVARADAPQAFAKALVVAVRGGRRPDLREGAIEWSRSRSRHFQTMVAKEATHLEVLTHDS